MAEIVIVEDHELLAEVLRMALVKNGVDAVLLSPCPLDELTATAMKHRPALVLLDLDLGTFGDTTSMIAPLTETGARVIIVSGLTDRLRIAAALEQGAIASCSKGDSFEKLLETVMKARGSDEPLDPAARLDMLDELGRARAERACTLAPFDQLTPREQDTLRSMAHGLTVSDIAQDWVVSETTVRTHVRGVLGKLEVRSQLGAVAAALRTGWLDSCELSATSSHDPGSLSPST